MNACLFIVAYGCSSSTLRCFVQWRLMGQNASDSQTGGVDRDHLSRLMKQNAGQIERKLTNKTSITCVCILWIMFNFVFKLCRVGYEDLTQFDCWQKPVLGPITPGSCSSSEPKAVRPRWAHYALRWCKAKVTRLSKTSRWMFFCIHRILHTLLTRLLEIQVDGFLFENKDGLTE